MSHYVKPPFDHPQQLQYTVQNYGELCLITDRYKNVKQAYSNVSFVNFFNNLGVVVNVEGGEIFQ